MKDERRRIQVAINGFGRIGRQVMKVVAGGGFSDLFTIEAVNDLTPPETLAHLLRYDSTYGKFPVAVRVEDDKLHVGDMLLTILSEPDPAKLPWQSMEVDVVIEATGRFTAADDARKHVEAGAKKVIVSAPSDGADSTFVLGVNESTYKPDTHHVISNASCTTNCIAPVVMVMHKAFGIDRGLMTTIHAMTNDQVILDQPHKDLRRARTASTNLIPTSTGAARALGLVLPELQGRVDGFAVRAPVETVSLVDLVVRTSKPVSVESINSTLLEASNSAELAGILGYCDEPLVSSDFLADTRSAIVDAQSTMTTGDRMAKVVAWYDNEWGYSCRVVDLLAFICEAGIPGTA